MSSEILLEMKNISKTFPGVRALKNVSFNVRRGEVMGLMGENGAGKSTLIKILTGYYHRDANSGEEIFDGRNINPKSTLEAQRMGISPIFQELNLAPNLTIAENIFLGNAPKKHGAIDWKAMREKAKEAMRELGVDVDVSGLLSRQPTAIQQMVSVARALSINAKLLIMDEATSSLDNAEVDILFNAVRRLKEKGIATIFVTHKMDEIYKICDRVTILKDGEFVTCQPIEEMPKLKLISLMLGRDASTLINKRKAYDPAKENAEALCEVKEIRTGTHRLNGINLKIRKGEVLGLAGLLGSGRTETAKVIFGDDQMYVGEVFMRQQAVHFKNPEQAIKSGLAFCSEDRKGEGIFPNMSVADNLTMPIMDRVSRFGMVNRRKQNEITRDYIQKMSIKTPSENTKIKDLSGGNQQKVILSRWLATKPDLVILDEPTRGIDVGAKGEIEDLIREISEQGISVLYISSEMDELVRGCDRVAVLRDGRVVGELTGEDISSDNIMKAIAMGEAV